MGQSSRNREIEIPYGLMSVATIFAVPIPNRLKSGATKFAVITPTPTD
jgi:N6-adenosine-specific RNA methylase IME4